jgi:hypothetical protein
MIVYPNEIDAGIGELVKANYTIAECSLLSQDSSEVNAELAKADLSNIEGFLSASWDLFPVYSLLVTADWNKNADVFGSEELIKAQYTPLHKPFNYMHKQDNQIGHIFASKLVDQQLKPLSVDPSTDEDNIPARTSIVTGSVVYKVYEDPQRQAFINQVIADIQAGQYCVSMECLFGNFDYIMMNAKGEQRLLARNEQTSFLTSRLRQYGGPGYFKSNGEEWKLGRFLRQITFSAHGLVKNPANPNSIISSKLNLFKSNSSSLGYITLDQLNVEESSMSETTIANSNVDYKTMYETLIAKHNDLQSNYNKLHAKADEVIKDAEDAKTNELNDVKRAKCELETNLATLQNTVAEKEKTFAKVKSDLETALVAETKKNDAERATWDAYKSAERTKSRIAAVKEADKDMDDEKVCAFVESVKDLNDTTFNTVVATMKSYANKTTKPVTSANVIDSVVASEAAPPLGAAAEQESTAVTKSVASWYKSGKKTSKNGSK